jgi:hypothetical protein
MARYSRWWPRALIGLAVLILAGGTAAALLIWQSRSSSTLEVLDPAALREATEEVISDTAAIAQGWTDGNLSSDVSGMVIAQQESLALLSVEIARTRDLIGELESRQDDGEEGSYLELERALASLSAAQSRLEAALGDTATLLSGLEPLTAADDAYRRGRTAMVDAVESHNQAVASGSTSFTASKEESAGAGALLDEATAVMQAMPEGGPDLEAALSAVAELKSAADEFIAACDRAESGDDEGHNALVAGVQSRLSAAPASILPSIDIRSWLQPGVDELMQPVLDDLEETRELLNASPRA